MILLADSEGHVHTTLDAQTDPNMPKDTFSYGAAKIHLDILFTSRLFCNAILGLSFAILAFLGIWQDNV